MRTVTTVLFLIAGCSLPLDGAHCPCATGWSCCAGAEVCVRDGDSCPAGDGGAACVPGESCPGDIPPISPQGTVSLGLAQLPTGTVQPNHALVVTFPIVITALNRNTTFTLLSSSQLLGDTPVAMQTTVLDDHDQPITSVVLPKTDGSIHEQSVKVRVQIPDVATPTPANVVLGMRSAWEATPPMTPLRPSSGQVQFTVGAEAPLSNAFSIDFKHANPTGTVLVDPQYGVLQVGVTDLVLLYLNADLSQMPAGEQYSLTVDPGTGWFGGGVVCAQPSASVVTGPSGCPSSFTLIAPGPTELWLNLQPPFSFVASQLAVTLTGTDPRHTSTYRLGLTEH